MFNIKTRARSLCKGKIFRSLILYCVPLYIRLSAYSLLLLFILSLIYSVPTVFSGWYFYSLFPGNDTADTVLCISLLIFSLTLFLFADGLKFAVKAYFYFRTDKNQSRPKSFISLRGAFRYSVKILTVRLLKLSWCALFFLPGIFSLSLTAVFVYAAELTKVRFIALVSLSAVLTLTAALFSAVTVNRYYLTDYILYLNPLMPFRHAIDTSVSLLSGKLIKTACARLSLLPWKMSVISVISIPFVCSYVSLSDALLCERLFGERKCAVKSPAVTFYINKKSVFVTSCT